MIHIIDVFGQFDSKGTDHYYTFPNGKLNINGNVGFLDTRSDLYGFNITEAFAIFCTATEGWWISIIKKNFDDQRQGYAMLSLCLGDQRPVNGAEAAQVLRQAFDHFVTNRTWDDAQSATWLQQLQTQPCAKTPFAGSIATKLNSAFRTYSSEAELAQQLSHISQHGYEKFSRIFLISSAAITVPTATASRMHNVTNEIPVRQFFQFQVPDGVKIKPAGAFTGERIQITYTKGMLESKPIDYVVGNPSKLATVDQQRSLININPAQGLGIAFFMKISFSFTDQRGNALKGVHFTDTPDLYFNKSANCYFASESLLQRRGEIVKFTCNGFHSRTLKAEELYNAQNNPCITIQFKPQEIKVCAVMGNYLYPLAKNFSQREAEDLVNKHLVEKQTDGKYIICQSSKSSGSAKDSVLDIFFKIMGLIFTILLVVYMIYALAAVCFDFKIWPFQQDAPQTEQTIDDGNSVSTDAADTYNDGTISDDDIDYLKKYDTWDTTALQSEQAKSLMAAISSGNVMNIISQHNAILGKVDQGRINGHWKKIIEMLQSIQTDSEKMGKAQDNISRICASDKFNLSELQSALQTICKASQSQGETRSAETAPTTTEHREAPQSSARPKSKENKGNKADKGGSNNKDNTKPAAQTKPVQQGRIPTE